MKAPSFITTIQFPFQLECTREVKAFPFGTRSQSGFQYTYLCVITIDVNIKEKSLLIGSLEFFILESFARVNIMMK